MANSAPSPVDPARIPVQQATQTLLDQVVNQIRKTRPELLPAVRVNVSDQPFVTDALGEANRMGEQLPNRVPYINTISVRPSLEPTDAMQVLRHELGHILEPSLVRNKGRAQAFTDIVGLDPRTKLDTWGLPLQGHPSGGLSPVEFYAQVVAGQLGNPTYADYNRRGLTNQQINGMMLSPAISLSPAKMKMLVQMGLIPKKGK